MRCHTCKKECERPQKCSKCQKTVYCSRDCQIVDWKQHKRSVCLKSPQVHQVEKMLKKLSGPNDPMGRLFQMENLAWAARVRDPQPTRACDGCFRLWDESRFDPYEDDEDTGRCGSRDSGKRCGDCDWTVCRDCLRLEFQERNVLERPTGQCRCLNSNFGVPYCTMTTSYIHGDQHQSYTGDRHPEISTSGYPETAFEDKPRKCKNCGERKLCLKKEHRKDLAPQVLLEGISH
ncbi:hypothetical protein C8J55DRAFT_71003 [Lentinula edodes]|uniref:MYND-type domain-containing protein n=1 Tax=Lentinula lateritia TaxID=40482 RepID=A0A9W9AFK0_9AGAR|nr:hypothetical protein C8J55DRAFT_71003 [Lentinula edodes]